MAVNRRKFLINGGSGLIAAACSPVFFPFLSKAQAFELGGGVRVPQPPPHQGSDQTKPIDLPPTAGPDEPKAGPPPSPLAPLDRVGYAVVGLGHLSLEEIMPAFGSSMLSRPVALVSGHREKAERVARQYGIEAESIYSYDNFASLAKNPKVQAVYIVLPNSMHKDFVLKSAAAGKHVLCEKPMATSSADAQAMVDACKRAGRKLMIAYRQQYEPNNVMIKNLIRSKECGPLRLFQADNSQNMGNPKQWRLHRALSGGGPLPDVGLYCINAVRFLSGEEPIEVSATSFTIPNDPRFTEVESTIAWQMRFPSGLIANCTSSYAGYKHQRFSFVADKASFGLDPAFAYHGNKIELETADGAINQRMEPIIDEQNQFSLEMDHFSDCILRNLEPQTPGEEGVRDMKIIEAIYESALKRAPVQLAKT